MATRRLGVVGALAAIVLVSAVAPAAAAGVAGSQASVTNAADETTPAFVVDLHADASATVTARYTFDLSSDDERNAFERIEGNETVRGQFADRFALRMENVAGAMENATGRSLSVSSPDVSLTTADGTGVASFSVEVTNFAGTRDGSLVVTEPFATDFDASRQLVVELPDGYEASASSPSPDSSQDGTLTWSAGTSLNGFELVTTSDGSADGSGQTPIPTPGFGVTVAVGGVLGAGLVALRRRP